MKVIDILKNKMGWNIDFIYRVNKPDKVLTPDLKKHINNSFEYWDIKTIGKSLTPKSKNKKIQHAITKQCSNFVIDLNSNC